LCIEIIQYLTDPNQVCKAVGYIEDRKIRLYDIEDRKPLRTPGQEWSPALQKYLIDVQCPHTFEGEWNAVSETARVRVLHWLFVKALAFHFSDMSADAMKMDVAAGNAASIAANSSGTPMEEEAECAAREEHIPVDFDERVRALSSRLGLPNPSPPSPNHPTPDPSSLLKTLQGILSIIQLRLSPNAEVAAKEGAVARLDIDDFPLSYTTHDPLVDRAARALTMLYVADLRGLQTDINDILVSAQEFTANPYVACLEGGEGRGVGVK
jgi:hypothetical protein